MVMCMKNLLKNITGIMGTVTLLPLLCGCENKNVSTLPVAQESYEWKNVQIVGGGFCDGIIFHPNAKDVRYARTDMGGAYRWDKKANRWVPMLDFIGYEDNNLVGVESVAVDPNDKKTVYLSCGTYTNSGNGAILYSHDGGKTLHRTDVPFAMGGNENGRGNGERMMVDPNNSNVIYVGTRKAGLWKSTDKARSWLQVESFMQAINRADSIDATNATEESQTVNQQNNRMFRDIRRNAGCGVVFVLFDEESKSRYGSQTIFVGYSRMNKANMFVSYNGGESWEEMPGSPRQYMPNHAVMSTDRKMYVSYGTNPGPNQMTDGGVWVYDLDKKNWTEITPDKPTAERRFGYASVSVDKNNPKHIIASSFGRPYTNGAGDEVFRSTDGGKSWKGVFTNGGQYDESKAPYVINTGIHWLFDIEIDPYNSDHAMFTTGYGGWETFNLSDMDNNEPTLWTVMSAGIEETVPLELYSPNKGAWLITGIGDYGGFTHWDLDKPADDSHHDPRFGNTNGVTGAELKPELVVRVGTVHGGYKGKTLSYSLDGGNTWLEPETVPDERGRNGHIAVSSGGEVWVWTPDRMPVYYTDDMGATWYKSEGIEPGIRVIADRVNPKRFYALSISKGLLYESCDGAKTFTSRPIGFSGNGGFRGDGRGGQDRVYATPGREGDLWIAAYHGLYRAVDGVNFAQQELVTEMHGFGFGAPAPDSDYPSLYMVGVVNGVRGFFRSDDAAASWVRINDDDHQYGLVLHITGDPKKYGRVYVGTHGRGALYADPK